MVDNVWYILDLDSPRRLGVSRGPDTPDVGGRHDWPPIGQDGYLVHWFRQNQTAGEDEAGVLIAANMQAGLGVTSPIAGVWRHFKFYASFGRPRAGVWLITDLPGFIAEVRAIAGELTGGPRNQLLDWATFLETSPLIPRVGDPS